MAIELKMDETGMQEAIRGAILAQLTAEAKERLIAGALEYLLKTPTSSYGHTPGSPLQIALNRAVELLANEMMREEVASNPAIRDAVRTHLGKAVEKLMDQDCDLSDAIAGAISKVLDRDR